MPFIYEILIHTQTHTHTLNYVYTYTTLCTHNALEITSAKQVVKTLMVSEWSESAQIVHLRFMTGKLRPKKKKKKLNAATHNESVSNKRTQK